MAISGISASTPPAAKPVTTSATSEIQKAAAAKASAQVKPTQPAPVAEKKATPPANVAPANPPAEKPSTPSVNTSGQVTGTRINTTA